MSAEIAGLELVTGAAPHLLFEGRTFPIEVKRTSRAARIKLRIDPRRGVVLQLPKRASLTAGYAFLRQELDWIASNIRKIPESVPFRDGVVLPLLGQPHQITHVPDARGFVWAENQHIYVAGGAEHLPRRVKDWTRKMAKTEISVWAADYAEKIDVDYSGITLRDQVTRWGSCSSTGRLNFSWRLILMPEEVMRYIVAHEVAHLRHMNHSAAFWSLVGEMHSGVEAAKKWLKSNGAELHKYGVE